MTPPLAQLVHVASPIAELLKPPLPVILVLNLSGPELTELCELLHRLPNSRITELKDNRHAGKNRSTWTVTVYTRQQEAKQGDLAI